MLKSIGARQGRCHFAKGADYIKGDGLRWLKGEQGSRQILIDVYLQNIKPEYKGKVYWVLLPMGAEPPSIDQIASVPTVKESRLSPWAAQSSVRQR